MSDRRAASGLLTSPPAWLFVALIAVRALALGLVIAGATRHPVNDPVVLRAERVATSPAHPYLDFPAGAMPLETVLARTLGGGGAEATAVKMALLAFVADLGAAAAMFWGWGRRPAATYLLVGLPLLSFIYLRFDLVSVALAAWAVALMRRRGDDVVGGAAFGLAIWAKLWPVVLLPLLWIVRARRAAMVLAGLVVLGGAGWYLSGGPKGPLQVLTQRGAVGWAAQSTMGNLLTVLTGSPVAPEGAVARIGTATTSVKGLLLIGLLVCELAVWWRALADQHRDASGATALVAVTIPLIFAPILSLQYLAWLLPWTAFAFEGDGRERSAGALATLAIALTGLLGLASPLTPPRLTEEVVTLGRNGLLIAVVVTWLVSGRSMAGRDARVAAAHS